MILNLDNMRSHAFSHEVSKDGFNVITCQEKYLLII